MKSDDLKKRSGAELRALAQQRQPSDPSYEARRHEESFLKNLTGARDHYEWIVANKAWMHLGYENHTAWYVARVHPLLLALGARPTPELSASILDHAREDEAELPPAQRMTQQEKAALAGVSTRTLQRQSQDRPEATMSHGADLENPVVDPVSLISDEAKAAIAAKTSGPAATSPAGGSGENTPAGHPLPSDTTEVPSHPVRAGDEGGQPEEDHRDAIPGEAGDGGPSGGNSSGADGGATPAAQTEPEGAVDPHPDGPVDGRGQQTPAGVSAPAAPVSKPFEFPDVDKLRQRTDLDQEAVEDYARKTEAHALALWRDDLTTAFVNFRKAFRAVSAEDIYEKADDELINLIVNTHADIQEKWTAVAELKVAAEKASRSNVVQLRSVS